MPVLPRDPDLPVEKWAELGWLVRRQEFVVTGEPEMGDLALGHGIRLLYSMGKVPEKEGYGLCLTFSLEKPLSDIPWKPFLLVKHVDGWEGQWRLENKGGQWTSMMKVPREGSYTVRLVNSS